MACKYKKIKVGFIGVLISICAITIPLSCCIIVFDIITRKPDVVIDSNYQGKYIKVLQYDLFNTDSAYHYFYKPKFVTVNVRTLHGGHLHIIDGKWEEIINVKDVSKYRPGQNIKVYKEFYPKVRYVELVNCIKK